MSATAERLQRAQRALAGVSGGIALLQEARRGLSRSAVRDWVRRLRAAADELEGLL